MSLCCTYGKLLLIRPAHKHCVWAEKRGGLTGASLALHVEGGFLLVWEPTPVGDGLHGEVKGLSHTHRPRGGLHIKADDGLKFGRLRSAV